MTRLLGLSGRLFSCLLSAAAAPNDKDNDNEDDKTTDTTTNCKANIVVRAIVSATIVVVTVVCTIPFITILKRAIGRLIIIALLSIGAELERGILTSGFNRWGDCRWTIERE
jgi:hypothetical protein